MHHLLSTRQRPRRQRRLPTFLRRRRQRWCVNKCNRAFHVSRCALRAGCAGPLGCCLCWCCRGSHQRNHSGNSSRRTLSKFSCFLGVGWQRHASACAPRRLAALPSRAGRVSGGRLRVVASGFFDTAGVSARSGSNDASYSSHAFSVEGPTSRTPRQSYTWNL